VSLPEEKSEEGGEDVGDSGHSQHPAEVKDLGKLRKPNKESND
jgi:hypothetical protein